MVKSVRKEYTTQASSWTSDQLKAIPKDAKVEGAGAPAAGGEKKAEAKAEGALPDDYDVTYEEMRAAFEDGDFKIELDNPGPIPKYPGSLRSLRVRPCPQSCVGLRIGEPRMTFG